MKRNETWYWVRVAPVLAVCAIFVIYIWGGSNSQPEAVASETTNNTLSTHSAPGPAATWTKCTPVEVMIFKPRIHVRCAAAVGGIAFFAAPTAEAQHAARILSLLSTAQVAGRTLSIQYDPADQSGTSIGCQTSDCRLIQAVGFGQ
ncbi:MAG: hypothetical protein ACREOI_34400 [bacterium]